MELSCQATVSGTIRTAGGILALPHNLVVGFLGFLESSDIRVLPGIRMIFVGGSPEGKLNHPVRSRS